MARCYAALFHEYGEEMQELSDAEFGRLCRALIAYSANGTPIELSGNERFYAKRVMAQEDRAIASYEKTQTARSEAAKAAATKRWAMREDANACERMRTHAEECVDMRQGSKNAKSISISNNNTRLSTNVDNNNKAKPSFEEVVAYCKERGNRVDPERWYAYYEANGWKVGRNPMKDWKAAVRTWERNNYDKPQQSKTFADMWREMAVDE